MSAIFALRPNLVRTFFFKNDQNPVIDGLPTMNFKEFFLDKSLNAKQKTELLGQWVQDHPDAVPDLIAFAQSAKAPVKATALEALEWATKSNPTIATLSWLEFATANLHDDAPRCRWESARVIGNICRQFPQQLEIAAGLLLANANHTGTVVRWSAAYALGEIIGLKTPLNSDLIPAAEAICAREPKNSIKKIYQSALKKAYK